MLNKKSITGILIWALLLHVFPAAASSWNPALLVNTETFQTIDDSDTASDLYVRFGDALNKRLTFERTLDRFNFNDDVYISGNITVSATASGKVIHAQDTLSSSGSLVWEGSASGASLWVSTFKGAGLVSTCDATTGKLTWNSTLQQFVCGTDSGTTYTAGQGLTLNGSSVFRLSDSFSGTTVKVYGTLSGSSVHAMRNLSIGSNHSGSLVTITRLSTGTKATLFSTDQMSLGQLEGGAYFGRIRLTENQWGLSNYGVTWTARETNRNWSHIAMSSDGKLQTALVYGGQIYISTDYGNSWTVKGLTKDWYGVAMSSDGKIQAAVVLNEKIYISGDYGNTWTAKLSDLNWREVAMSSDGKTQTGIVYNGQIYTSTNYGATWTARASNRSWQSIAMSSDGKMQTAVVNGGQIYVSMDYGITWTAYGSSGSWDSVAMSDDGKLQTAVISSGQIYISNDYGSTWSAKDSSRSWHGIAMSSEGKIQTATTNGTQLYTSTDYGQTWTARSSNGSWNSVAMSSDGKIQAVVIYGGQIYTSYADSSARGDTYFIGTASGRILHAQDQLRSSGTLAIGGNAFMRGDLTINSDNGANDATLTFGNTAAQTLLYSNANSRFEFSANINSTGTISAGNGRVVSGASGILGQIGNSAGGDLHLAADYSNGVYIKQGGNVGIGTIAPETTLEVIGTASGRILHAQDQLRSSGSLSVDGASKFKGTLTFGDAIGDAISVNAGSWTFANDTNFALTGGVNGLSFDTSTLSIDASNDRIGIGTTAPKTKLEVTGTMSGAAVFGYNVVNSQSAKSGSILVSRVTGAPEWKRPTGAMVWFLDGLATVATPQGAEVTMPFGMSGSSVNLRAVIAPTGSDLEIDIRENGTTLFSTKPKIAAGSTTGGGAAVFSDQSIAAGSVLSIGVTAKGSTIAGSGITIQLNGIRNY